MRLKEYLKVDTHFILCGTISEANIQNFKRTTKKISHLFACSRHDKISYLVISFITQT